MATTVSNKIKYLLATKNIDFANDAFQIILMATGFTFNKDTHHGYSDVSAYELATGNGYTAGGITLTGVSVTEDDVDDRAEVTWSNAQWNATGAGITACGAIIFDDTPTTPQADPVVQYIDFGGDQTASSGGTFTVANPATYIT